MNDHPNEGVTRRQGLATLALGGAALVAGCAARGDPAADRPPPLPKGESSPMTPMPALAGQHQLQPLPFAPSSLTELSERLIVSHHENNYGGAVRNLNRVEQELAAITASTPPFVVAALRERELMFRNSKTLHEAYFGNLGGSGRCSGAIEKMLAGAYGTLARWEEQFRATGLGLGGGSGWVILTFELDGGALRTVGSVNHMQAQAAAQPLLVLDMYEHSYQMDFGAAAARYIDAFFANIHWDEVNRRLEHARAALAALRG